MCSRRISRTNSKKKEPEPLSEMKLPSEEEMAKLRQLIKKEEEFQKLEKAKEQMRINKLKKNKPKKLKPMPKKIIHKKHLKMSKIISQKIYPN